MADELGTGTETTGATDTTDTTGTTDTTDTTVRLDELKNLFNLKGKNAGGMLALRGKVVLVAFLINDGESRWDAAAEAEMVQVLKDSSEHLMNVSGLNKKDLQIAYAYRQVDIPYAVTRVDMSRCVSDVLRQFGYKTVSEYQKHYETKFSRDEAAITFVFNKDFRSFAHSIVNPNADVNVPSPAGDEYSMMSFTKGESYNNEKTFVHELMHQFGAIDLYYPEFLKFKAQKMLPDSIMNGGQSIDPLTRYLIGWDEEPANEAMAFLKAIENVTEEDIAFALNEERKNDW